MSSGSNKNRVIRVGFILEVSDWLGGINYYRSLFSALRLLPEPKIEPVLFVSTEAEEGLVEQFGPMRVVRSSLLSPGSPSGILRRAVRKVLGQRDPALELMLRGHGVDVLSHYSGALSRGTRIKTVGWIPDFQFLHLPDLFTAEDIARRGEAVRLLTDHCDRLIVSSAAAQDDLGRFVPEALSRSRVLHFVPEVDACESLPTLADLEQKYGFQGPYFYLPNQFWAHKNHRVVVDALGELRQAGRSATVLATGKTHDHRHPAHFEELMSAVAEAGLSESFRVLGIVPYGDLLSLMHHSLAVINPSFCEGWSTTVEESKALDKTLLLSDLPVHREQNPPRGIFFNPRDPRQLADMMMQVQTGAGGACASGGGLELSRDYSEKRIQFAREYQEIILKLCSEGLASK